MATLQDQVAIVTGGAMGIGGATARRLAAEGARVLVADYLEEDTHANVARIRAAGGTAEGIKTDVTVPSDLEKMVKTAVKTWGRLDILVNNAYSAREPDGSAVDLTESAWDYVMNVGLKAIFLAVKYTAPHMQKSGRGSIVNLASVHGLLMAPRTLAYEAAKSAVIGITRQMAIDFGPAGIRVNAICPGHIVTEKIQKWWDKNPTLFAMFQQQYPVRRTGTPDDIANAIRFLCSDEASFIIGHALVVDGGLTIQLQENYGNHIARYMRDHPDTQLPTW